MTLEYIKIEDFEKALSFKRRHVEPLRDGVCFIPCPQSELGEKNAQCNRCKVYLDEDEVYPHVQICQSDIIRDEMFDYIKRHWEEIMGDRYGKNNN